MSTTEGEVKLSDPTKSELGFFANAVADVKTLAPFDGRMRRGAPADERSWLVLYQRDVMRMTFKEIGKAHEARDVNGRALGRTLSNERARQIYQTSRRLIARDAGVDPEHGLQVRIATYLTAQGATSGK